jgi:beta-glucosidase
MARRSVLFSLVSVAIAVVSMMAGPAAAEPAGGPPPLGPGFLWGVASAGFQNEGSAPDSNWTRYLAHSGRSTPPAGPAPQPYRDSVDFYHRYRGDIALARDLGAKVYRLSVEWARLEPAPGRWDPAAFAYYDNVIATIRAAGMRPMITLDHWVYPGWAAARGGWSDPAMVGDWLVEARKVVDRYAGADPLWVTLNEAAFYPLQEARIGAAQPTAAPVQYDRMVAAHNSIYDYIHARQPGALVTGNVIYIPGLEPVLDGTVENRIKLDYVGIDYYYGSDLAHAPDLLGAFRNQPWTAPLTPEGIYYALRYYARRFPGRPLYIVENGMPTDDGRVRADGWDRADLLRDTVYWLQRAKADGMDVIGYNYWSLTDNYEWGSYAPRFGLYTVDVDTDPTLTRRPTDAVAAYRAVIARGGVPAGYRPTRPPVRCSLVDFPTSCVQPVTVP